MDTSEIQFNDYKRIKKELGLTPGQWHEIQNQAERKRTRHIFNKKQIEIYKCACGSPFCPDCVTTAKAFKRIIQIMDEMDYKKVRNVMLSINRQRFSDASEAYEYVKRNKCINNLIQKLTSIYNVDFRYLWIIEFHKDGFPHWHMLIEGLEKMIGNALIQEIWDIGFTWETYIKDENHWKSIKGYGKKKGYFGFEQKEHQIKLPEPLLDHKRIRKFGTNVPRRTIVPKFKRTNKKACIAKTYRERFKLCGQKTKVRDVGNNTWVEINEPYKLIKEKLTEIADAINFQTFNSDDDEIITKITPKHP